MKIILLSGGSGKRLWPLSNTQRSKQFIKALKNPRTNEVESMVQRVWRQLEEVGLQNDTYIATGEGQRSLLQKQLGIDDSKIIIEPSRRDTFPALSLAATYLFSIAKVPKNEIMIALPVDPYVDTEFFEKVKKVEDLLIKDNSTLGLIGIKPTFASEKYGYIVPAATDSTKVASFQEKPNMKVAEKLINEGALWNSGVFGLKIQTLLDLLESRGLPIDYNGLVKNYEQLPKNSFDYEYSEKQKNISFITYDGFWKDLGTWNTLTEELASETVGEQSILIDSNNTHIINDTSLPIAVIGASDLVVAAGPEGILVSKKELSPRVKEIPSEFFETIHYVEEDWGVRKTLYHTDKVHTSCYEVLDNHKFILDLKDNQTLLKLSGKGNINFLDKKVKVEGIDGLIFIVITEGA